MRRNTARSNRHMLLMSMILLLLLWFDACHVASATSETQHVDTERLLSIPTQTDAVVEYCQLETFSARCRHGDVVVMTTARFGRMRVGKCIDSGADSVVIQGKTIKTIGCYADVLDYVDRTCSGKTSCDIAVPNRHLLSTRPCFAQLTMYFEAAYSCVSVVEQSHSCTVSASTQSVLHIRSSPQNGDSGRQRVRCGTRSHPWLLEAQTGQQVNISLLDFSGHGGQTQLDTRGLVTDHCNVQYGYVVEKTNKNNVSICSTAVQQRHKHLYQSTGNLVEIILVNDDSISYHHNYLISFIAVGCSNLVPPSDAWLRRTDNEATIGCYTTRQRWNLRCDGNRWTGTIGVCSSHDSEMAIASEATQDVNHADSLKSHRLHQILMILAISFIGLAVCLLIIFIGIACIRRYDQRRAKPEKCLINYHDNGTLTHPVM